MYLKQLLNIFMDLLFQYFVYISSGRPKGSFKRLDPITLFLSMMLYVLVSLAQIAGFWATFQKVCKGVAPRYPSSMTLWHILPHQLKWNPYFSKSLGLPLYVVFQLKENYLLDQVNLHDMTSCICCKTEPKSNWWNANVLTTVAIEHSQTRCLLICSFLCSSK